MKSIKLFFLSLIFIPFTASALCVNVSQANLRSKPSKKGRVLWTVGKYMPLIGIRSKGNWVNVKDLDGKKMWIHGGLVSEDIDCAVVKVNNSSLRNGPGTNFSKTLLSYAGKYMAFKKLGRDGAWLQLQDDFGHKHWVFEKNLWEPLAYSNVTY